MLEYEDEESNLRIKRLWSFYDAELGRRFYADILQMPDDRRRRLVRQYAQFLDQLRSVRRAMADYFAGQQFFDFYVGDEEEELVLESSLRRAVEAEGATRLDLVPVGPRQCRLFPVIFPS